MRVALDGRVLDRQVFYSLPERPEYARMGLAEATEAITELLRDSIRLRLRSDVRVGTCLSGGLDSSAISTIASSLYRQSGGEEFIGIHARSIERSTDESEFAQQVAQRSGIRLVTVAPSSEDFAATIDEVVYTQEEPFGSPSMFMGWHVFREAQRQGCRVMLNGPGCDEAYRLMEAAASLPLEHKLQAGWTKYVMRRVAESHLPKEVTWRKVKLGFEAPTGVWFRERNEMMRKEIESSPILSEYADLVKVRHDWHRLGARHRWTMFNLATWSRVYGVSA